MHCFTTKSSLKQRQRGLIVLALLNLERKSKSSYYDVRSVTTGALVGGSRVPWVT